MSEDKKLSAHLSSHNEDEDLRNRLQQLRVELDQVEQKHPSVSGSKGQSEQDVDGKNKDGNALGQAMRMGSDLVAGVLVGSFIGYWLDQQTGLTPLFMVMFLIFGIASGFWNVYRLSVSTSSKKTGVEMDEKKTKIKKIETKREE